MYVGGGSRRWPPIFLLFSFVRSRRRAVMGVGVGKDVVAGGGLGPVSQSQGAPAPECEFLRPKGENFSYGVITTVGRGT